MSKGSNPRPLSIPKQDYDSKFDAIFKRPPKCDCAPGQCQKPAERCKDWNQRGEK